MTKAAAFALVVLFCLPALADADGPKVSVPTLIRVEDKAVVPHVPATVRIAIYADRTGGEALWIEEQLITPGEDGRFTVWVGASQVEGIPAGVFGSTEGRWIGIASQGQEEQPRFLVAAVPYALRAREAETIGGRPLSDFIAVSDLEKRVKELVEVRLAEDRPATLLEQVPRFLPVRPAARQPKEDGFVVPTVAGDFEHLDPTAHAIGVRARVSSDLNGVDPSQGVTAVLGEVTTNAPGLYSAAVRGINRGWGGAGIGVAGLHSGSGWGVYGQSPEGIGVYGHANDSDRAGTGVFGSANNQGGYGVHASYGGTGVGTALFVSNGALRVGGAMPTAFMHAVSTGNRINAYSSWVDNPICNGDPNALLFITPKSTGTGSDPAPIVVTYDSTAGKWVVLTGDATALATGTQMNVLVIKR